MRPASLLILPLLLVAAPGAAARAPAEDPELAQTIRGDQPVAPDRRVLGRGHVDVGPRYVDGRWRLMIHDDVAKTTGGESVWRHPDRTVIKVSDRALLPVPDDPAYGFLGQEPGTRVHVIPQTLDPGVVWLGWNTQDPEVRASIDRGATLTLRSVDGPGTVTVFLQDGSFDRPRVLWRSSRGAAPLFVDVDTHAHANWVFSAPGVYLVRVEVAAELRDGRTVSDVRDLRFAVGDGTPADDAFAATAPAGAGAGDDGAVTDEDDGGADPTVLLVIGGGALVLVGAVGVVTARGRRAKRAARAGSDAQERT